MRDIHPRLPRTSDSLTIRLQEESTLNLGEYGRAV
jgi:hypothetical protein